LPPRCGLSLPILCSRECNGYHYDNDVFYRKRNAEGDNAFSEFVYGLMDPVLIVAGVVGLYLFLRG
jgi:hypothetical protein